MSPCRFLLITLVLVFQGPGFAATPLEQFFAKHCVKCHGSQEPMAGIRLDRSVESQLSDVNSGLLDKVLAVLEAGEMPPESAMQPAAEAKADAIELIQEIGLSQQRVTVLKRITRLEYTNTLKDLFGVEFDLTGLLPPDHVERGFDKFGDAHLMSSNQVAAYLKTARFLAERLLPANKPETSTWEFDVRHFYGSGRGDYRDDDGFLLSAFRPWRSNIHFSVDPESYERFKIPAFGRYRFEVSAHSVKSKEGEIIGVNLGDARYPVNFRNIRRVPMPHGSQGFTVELTLRAGDEVSFTFDSGRVQSTGGKPKEFDGAKMKFASVKVAGPIVEEWPTVAMQLINPDTNWKPSKLVDHIALLLTRRRLPPAERAAFVELVRQQNKASMPPQQVARSVLTALLTSPHFIYKSESPELTSVELAHRLSYFLWNSVPDTALLEAAGAGALASDPSQQLERMFASPKVERFVDDFTRQWLQLDKVDDFGPDVRVYKNIRRITVESMAREGSALFRHLLRDDLSMVHFIDSDFVMANDRLARFYKLPAVTGDAFVPVTLPENSERGGLVAQAGFLKLTSTDYATSPIRRGAWIINNLYNEQIDPPSDVVINEPDIRGTTSVRDALLKHQQLESCSRCHSRIDPLGFALEYYDPVGRKRTEYRHVEVVNTKKLEFSNAPINSDMKLPDGRELSDLATLKVALMEDKERILKGIIGKIISYAHGRELTVADRPYVDAVYEGAKSRDFSLRAAIEAIVSHPEFGKK